MTEETIRAGERALTQADPLLGTIIQSQKLETLEPRSDYFAALVRSIIGQQVSVAAASAIQYPRRSESVHQKDGLIELAAGKSYS